MSRGQVSSLPALSARRGLEFAKRPLRRAIAAEVHKLVSSRASLATGPAAAREDQGFFGDASVAWRVHGDFTTMLVGGVSALLLQMLHPAALAGVWDHSRFKDDMAGRLRRTAQFMSVTTFGSKAQARNMIDHVQAIHDRISGTLPDGRPYTANDPDLLTWVHVAGSWSFLQSFMLFGEPVSAADQDRYFEETAAIAEMLGAADVPKTGRAVEAYLQGMRPHLRRDSRTAAVAAALLNQPAPTLLQEPVRKLLMGAGIGLLPNWAAAMHGFERGPGQMARIAGTRTLRKLTNWALKPGASE